MYLYLEQRQTSGGRCLPQPELSVCFVISSSFSHSAQFGKERKQATYTHFTSACDARPPGDF